MSRRIESTIHADRAGRGAALPTATRPRGGATINAHGQKSPVPGLDGTPRC